MTVNTISKALKKFYKSAVGADPKSNNPTKIINELADNWSGGGGSGDLTYANVKANFVGENNPTGFGSYFTFLIQNNAFNECITYAYSDDEGIPLSDLGSITNIKVPVHKNYKTNIGNLTFSADGGYLILNTPECSVVSGDAEIDEGNQLLISGDCELNLTLKYAD